MEPPEGASVPEVVRRSRQTHETRAGWSTSLVPRGLPAPHGRRGWRGATLRGLLSHPTSTGVVSVGRQRFVEEGLEALEERPRPGKQPKLDKKAQARLIAEACSTAPDGRQRWTLHLLADRVVALGLAASYSYESVRRVLKKRSSSHGGRSKGASRR